MLIKDPRKYLAGFFLVAFCASASLAAANDPGLPSRITTQTMHPANETPLIASAGINSECFTGYFTNFRNATADPERKDAPAGPTNDCFEETAAIALHKDGNEIIWGLAPSLARFSLNPIDDIKNLEVLLQYRF